jgi:hypothetical protein
VTLNNYNVRGVVEDTVPNFYDCFLLLKYIGKVIRRRIIPKIDAGRRHFAQTNDSASSSTGHRV